MKHANNAVLIIEYTVTPIRANLSLGANTINTAIRNWCPQCLGKLLSFLR